MRPVYAVIRIDPNYLNDEEQVGIYKTREEAEKEIERIRSMKFIIKEERISEEVEV